MGTNNKVGHPIIFFDGVCNLCNASINFIIRRDKKSYFRFALLQSDFAATQLGTELTKEGKLQSLILLMNGTTYMRSRAILEISRRLSGLWPMLYFFIIVPPFLRNYIYDVISANRYNFFGKQDQCMIPTPELRNLFIDSTIS